MVSKKDDNSKYSVEYEDLAVPEVHTHKVSSKDSDPGTTESITYDTVAIPEIHVIKQK